MKMDKHNNIEPSGEFAASIRDFRSAVTHVAERETARPVSASWLAPARKRRRSHQQRMVLGWALAALACFATTLPWTSHSHQAAIHSVTSAAVAAAAAPAPESDTALLEQVDADVSESVPAPLAPLTELDSLDSTNSSGVSSGYGKSLTSTEKTNVAR